jgi:hypothetical protein
MRIQLFGYRVYISTRGFVVLGGLIVGVIVLFFVASAFWPKSAPKTNFLFAPAFSQSYVRSGTAKQGWLGPFESADGLFRPRASAQFRGTGFAPNVGKAFELEVYVPDASNTQAAAYQLSAPTMGKTFLPAYFINPDQPTTISDLDAAATQPADPNFILVGFPQDRLPVAGQAYSIKAMLWWRSDLLSNYLQAPTDQQQSVSPVFLADSYSALDPAQLRAPATQAVDLDLVYSEGGQQLTIHRVEWSAGSEVRVRVTLTNLTNQPLVAWTGLQTSSASIAQQPSVQGAVDQESPLATLSSLDAQQSVTGYIVFDKSVADPNQQLTLRMPSLSVKATSGQDLILIRVTPDRLVSTETGQSQTTTASG